MQPDSDKDNVKEGSNEESTGWLRSVESVLVFQEQQQQQQEKPVVGKTIKRRTLPVPLHLLWCHDM
jgi:hypothetical protein